LKNSFQVVILIVSLSLLLTRFCVIDTEARPEFAAREDKECSFCHLDPAGGGPRNPVGKVYEENGYEFPKDFDPEAVMEQIEELAKTFTPSIDIRTAYIKTTDVAPKMNAVASCNNCHSSVDSFFLMQGELTVNAQPSKKLKLTLSNNMGSTLNMFATVDAVPKHLYVKVGQFRLPFGIKQKDHNILVHQGYHLGSNKRDVGIEVGGAYGKLFYNAAVFNGRAPGQRVSGDTVDANQHKGWTATVGGAAGPLRGGVSYLLDTPLDRREMVASAFLTAAYKNLSLEGEFDFGGDFGVGEGIGFSDEDITSKGYYLGAKYRISPKFILSGRYELFDRDRRIRGDAGRRVTLTARYDIIDNGSLELYYWGNIENKDRLDDASIGDAQTLRQLQGVDQFILMSHFWF